MKRQAGQRGWKIIAGSIVVLALAVLAFYFSGGRWFTVITPSMATYAPVGTFVVSTAVLISTLRVGDMILFHPPGVPDSTYFHRIVAINDAKISTQGDLNHSVDPWTVDQTNLIGREVIHIVNFGWFLQALPIIVIGAAILVFTVERLVPRYQRLPVLLLGSAMILSTAALIVKPFVRAVMVSETAAKGKAYFDFVPTGVFDVVAKSHVQSVTRSPGEIGHIVVTALKNDHRMSIELLPALSPFQSVLIGAVCAAPVIITAVWLLRIRYLNARDDRFRLTLTLTGLEPLTPERIGHFADAEFTLFNTSPDVEKGGLTAL